MWYIQVVDIVIEIQITQLYKSDNTDEEKLTNNVLFLNFNPDVNIYIFEIKK